MLTRNMKRGMLVGLGVLAIGAPLTIFAQGLGGGQQGDQPPGGGQPGMRFQPMGMGGGGGAAIALDSTHLFVVQGNRVFKIRKSDLAIDAQATLPGQQRMQPGGPGGAPPPIDGAAK